jgi:hypothetical protein
LNEENVDAHHHARDSGSYATLHDWKLALLIGCATSYQLSRKPCRDEVVTGTRVQ